MLIACAALALVCLHAPSALAQPPQGFVPAASAARTPNTTERTGHAWMVLPVQGVEGALKREFALLHIPPRDTQGLVTPGTARVASRFNAMPDGLAAWENRVYIVFGRENRPEDVTFGAASDSAPAQPAVAPPPPRVQRRVVSLIAAPTVAGSHEFLPLGTVEARPALPGSGLLADIVGTADGPMALLGPDEFGAGRWSVLRLVGDAWIDVPLPSDLSGLTAEHAPRSGGPAASQPWARLACSGPGAWLLVGDTSGSESRVRAWRCVPERATIEDQAPRWSWALLPGASRGDLSPDLRRAVLTYADSEMLAVDRDGSSAGTPRLWRVGLASAGLVSPSPIAQTPSADAAPASGASAVGVAALDGLGRVLIAASEAVPAAPPPADRRTTTSALPPAPPPPGTTRVRVREVSIWSGAEVYAGTAKREGVLTPRDFQVLTFVVGGLMLAVMAFVLRSDASQTLSLPTGVSLARPAGRVLAAAVDLAAAIIIASLSMGLSPASVFGWHLLVGASLTGWMPLLIAWGLAIVLAAAQEWLTGRTLGKRLVGCEVLGLHKDPGPAIEGARFGSVVIGRPTLWQAILRNLIRWGVPPLGLLMVFDANWRHAGDLLAGTVVVNPAEEEA